MRHRSGRVNVAVLVGALVVALPLFAVLVQSFGRNPRAVPDALVGKAAPGFTMTDLEGETHTLAAHAGQPVVINFWSTWCLPCKQEHPLLLKAPTLWPDAQFYGVVYSDDPVLAERYLERAGSAYPHLVDPGGAMAIDYGVAGVPETYFIDEHGVITYKHKGPLTVEAMVQQLGPSPRLGRAP